MNARRRTAFTLPELMIVILVIGLLAAIILPFFERAYQVQRRVTCGSNLAKLGQAYHTRMAKGAAEGAPHRAPGIYSWPQALLEYVSQNLEVFKCPEDEKTATASETAMEKLKEIYIEVFRGPAGNYDNWYWDVPIVDATSEWVWRLSQEQWDEVAARGGHGVGYSYTGYKEGADPTKWWFTFEDQGPAGGGDRDYWDQMIRIEVTDTEVLLYPYSGAAGYNFSLAVGKGENKTILIKDMKAAHEKPLAVPGGFGKSSYGMNSLAERIPEGRDKILLLDYEKTIARGSTFDELDKWLEDEETFPTKTVRGDPIPQFFRHFNEANVLFNSGAVRLMSYGEISLYEHKARQRYWDPVSE